MTGTDGSPQRSAAAEHLARARGHWEKRHYDRAMEEAHLALETDQDFDDVRYFLAEAHEQTGESRKAVIQYEALLFKHPHDEALLAKIESLDPATAAKHRRLSDLAPDPFVSQARLAGDDEFVDMDEDYIEAAPAEAPSAQLVGAAVAIQGAPPSDQVFADDEEFLDTRPPAGVLPHTYEYEDEPQFRESAAALPAIREALSRQRSMWADSETLEALLARSQPLSASTSPEALLAFSHASSLFGTPITVAHVIDDPSLRPVVCGSRGAYVMIPTGALRAFAGPGLRALMGRTLARIACEHVPLLDVAAAVLPSSTHGSALEEAVIQVALGAIGGPEALGEESASRRAQGHLHTWRLRAELTADRAGLVCCGDVGAAASLMARLTAPDADSAPETPQSLDEHFAGQDLARIAAIPVDRDPLSSKRYAHYRIKMLLWWSKQPGYAALSGQA